MNTQPLTVGRMISRLEDIRRLHGDIDIVIPDIVPSSYQRAYSVNVVSLVPRGKVLIEGPEAQFTETGLEPVVVPTTKVAIVDWLFS